MREERRVSSLLGFSKQRSAGEKGGEGCRERKARDQVKKLIQVPGRLKKENALGQAWLGALVKVTGERSVGMNPKKEFRSRERGRVQLLGKI